MSKIGKTPIKIKESIKFEINESSWIISGPNGSLSIDRIRNVEVLIGKDQILVTLADENMPNGSAYWGLARSLINNACIGVTEGFIKELELVGVGYRAEKQGSNIKLAIGYSHPVIIVPENGITLDLEGNTIIKVKGIDKQIVGQMAANIRAIRKPEPYKGKGIKYKDEVVRRKQGKASK